MTQKQSLSKSEKAPFVTPYFMFDTARRAWTLCVLFFAAFLLCYTIPTIMFLMSGNRAGYYDTTAAPGFTEADRIDAIMQTVANFAKSISLSMTVASMISAVAAGCYSFMFMHNKVSAGFYHSLPEQRRGHFITALFTSASTYLTALLSNFAVSLLIYAATGFINGKIVGALFAGLGYAVFYFFVILSLTFLAGSVSGNFVIQALMTGFFLFVLPVVHISACICYELYDSGMGPHNLIFDYNIMRLLTPTVRGVSAVLGDSDTGWYILLDVVLAAAAFALSYLAYKRRPIEKSGTPVIYNALGATVKYVVMGCSAILMARIFFVIVDSSVWLIVGFAAGYVLSFMVCNSILKRSAKAMFSGMRGFAVFGACLIVVAVALISHVFGLGDRIVPMTDELVVRIDDCRVTVRDKDAINAIRGVISDCLDDGAAYSPIHYDSYHKFASSAATDMGVSTPVYTEEDLEFGVDEDYFREIAGDGWGISRSFYLGADFKAPAGVTLEYSYGSIRYEYAKRIVDILIDLPDFWSGYDGSSGILEPVEYDSSRIDAVLSGDMLIPSTYAGDDPYGVVEQLSGKYIQARMQTNLVYPPIDGPESFLHPAIGSTSSRRIAGNGFDDYTISSYFTFDMLKAAADYSLSTSAPIGCWIESTYDWYDVSLYDEVVLDAEAVKSMTEDDYYKSIAETISKIVVYSRKTDSFTTIEGDEIVDMLPRLASLDHGSSYSSLFTPTDENYSVLVITNTALINRDANGITVLDATYGFVTWFIDGAVPASLAQK